MLIRKLWHERNKLEGPIRDVVTRIVLKFEKVFEDREKRILKELVALCPEKAVEIKRILEC